MELKNFSEKTKVEYVNAKSLVDVDKNDEYDEDSDMDDAFRNETKFGKVIIESRKKVIELFKKVFN